MTTVQVAGAEEAKPPWAQRWQQLEQKPRSSGAYPASAPKASWVWKAGTESLKEKNKIRYSVFPVSSWMGDIERANLSHGGEDKPTPSSRNVQWLSEVKNPP